MPPMKLITIRTDFPTIVMVGYSSPDVIITSVPKVGFKYRLMYWVFVLRSTLASVVQR